MVKAAISALAMAALLVFAAERALKIDQHFAEMRIVSSDANARQLNLGYKKAVVIDLPIDIKEVLVADAGTVTVIMRTTRRVYITGVALGKTNIFFFGDDGRQIAVLDVWVSDIVQPQPVEFGDISRRQQRGDAHALQVISDNELVAAASNAPVSLRLPQQPRQLGDVGRDAPRLVPGVFT
jgi:Flp pilus assembly secretin CpaC